MNLHEQKDFDVNSSSLKSIRDFARNFFDRDDLFKNHRDDLVLAIAEAAQNIVKHAYNGTQTSDKMRIEISLKENILKIDLFDKGKPAIPQDIQPRKLDDIKPGGLGTYFIKEVMDEVTFKTKNEKLKYMDGLVFKTNKEKNWTNHLVLTKNL
tara:strand:- start:603 stop:1061 length:459 start_codon:yes stop_codon:yes gene_type:complete